MQKSEGHGNSSIQLEEIISKPPVTSKPSTEPGTISISRLPAAEKTDDIGRGEISITENKTKTESSMWDDIKNKFAEIKADKWDTLTPKQRFWVKVGVYVAVALVVIAVVAALAVASHGTIPALIAGAVVASFLMSVTIPMVAALVIGDIQDLREKKDEPDAESESISLQENPSRQRDTEIELKEIKPDTKKTKEKEQDIKSHGHKLEKYDKIMEQTAKESRRKQPIGSTTALTLL